jgi:hypothetical protein
LKLPLDVVLLNTDDTTAKDEKGADVTLRTALIRAVLSEFDGQMQPLKGEAKLQRYDLYRALKKGTGDTDFTPEEVVVMRSAALIYPPLVCGQIRDLLS